MAREDLQKSGMMVHLLNALEEQKGWLELIPGQS